jgi:type IV pilus assembly protein PilM
MATGIGIDIGTEHIKVVQARVSKSGVVVTGALKLARRSVNDPTMEESSNMVVPDDLGQQLRHAGLGRTGTLGVSGREIVLRYLATPPVPPQKLKMLIDMEVGGKLTARGGGDTPAVTYDWRLLNVPSGLRGDLVIMAGLCKNEYLFGVNAALRQAGVTPASITPSCFGLVNAYLRTQQIPANETVVLVEVGHELLEVAILEERTLYFARSAPGGGKKFTAALDKVLHCGPAKAAEFKHERARLYPEGAQIPSKQELLFQAALKEGAENIAGAIRSSVMFCRTQAKLPKLDYQRVVLSGGGARLNGLKEYLEKKLGRPVQILDLSSGLDMRKMDAASAKCFEGDVPDMAVALGLAIVDADPDAFHFSLLPETIIKRQRFWRKTVYGIAAGVVMMAGLALPIAAAGKAVGDARERVAALEQRESDADKERRQFNKDLQQNRFFARQADYGARLTRMGRVYLEFFAKLRAAVPDGILLSSLGPASERDGGGIMPAGGGVWGIDEPVRDFLVTGSYNPQQYPATKINDAFKTMREQLKEVPGVREVSYDITSEDPGAAAKPGSKPFQFKVYLWGDEKPIGAPRTATPATKTGKPGPQPPAKTGPGGGLRLPAKKAGP